MSQPKNLRRLNPKDFFFFFFAPSVLNPKINKQNPNYKIQALSQTSYFHHNDVEAVGHRRRQPQASGGEV